MSDYLFDKEGPPDPEVERLERLLSPLAYRGAPPRLPAPPRRPSRRAYVVAGVVAASALAALLVWRPWRPGPITPPPVASWAAVVRGAASLDGRAVTGDVAIPVGAWLESGPAEVHLVVGEIGTIELAPGSRARIVASEPLRQQLRLERGALSARVNAPPRRFVIETPRAVVTDLGCAFTLTVDAQGRGRLVVTEGRVAIAEGPAAEIVVAAGGSADFALPPTVPQPNAPVPTQKPAPKQPMPKHSTPKPGKASPHAPPAAPQPATQRPPAPATPRPPAKVPPPADPGVKLKHDAFKDLDSVR